MDTIDFLDRLLDQSLLDSETKEIIVAWSCDEDIWLRRLAIDYQRLRKEKTDTELFGEDLCE